MIPYSSLVNWNLAEESQYNYPKDDEGHSNNCAQIRALVVDQV